MPMDGGREIENGSNMGAPLSVLSLRVGSFVLFVCFIPSTNGAAN
jgi:hypothetical protein